MQVGILTCYGRKSTGVTNKINDWINLLGWLITWACDNDMFSILQENEVLRKQNVQLSEENGKLVGHKNHKQRIEYLVKLKKENTKLQEVTIISATIKECFSLVLTVTMSLWLTLCISFAQRKMKSSEQKWALWETTRWTSNHWKWRKPSYCFDGGELASFPREKIFFYFFILLLYWLGQFF